MTETLFRAGFHLPYSLSQQFISVRTLFCTGLSGKKKKKVGTLQVNHCRFWLTWTSPAHVFSSDTIGANIVLVELSTQAQDQILELSCLIFSGAVGGCLKSCPFKWQQVDQNSLDVAFSGYKFKKVCVTTWFSLLPCCVLFWMCRLNNL